MTVEHTDARLAAELAAAAGSLLQALRRTSGLTGRELGKRGDADSNQLLLRELATARPDDAVLSEESADSPERLSADRVWIIDPLDGTREYGMPGRVDWAVHVALWEAGKQITAAAVAQPELHEVYASDQVSIDHVGADQVGADQVGADQVGTGRFGDGRRLRFLVSDSRPPEFADAVAAALDAELTPMGSAGAKAMAVLRGDADAYLHSGGQWEWDSAAPVGVALAAGLHASRIDGSELQYNSAHPYLPDLLICRSDLAQRLLAAIGDATS